MSIFPGVTGGLQHHNFFIFDGKISGSVDVKITPDFYSATSWILEQDKIFWKTLKSLIDIKYV